MSTTFFVDWQLWEKMTFVGVTEPVKRIHALEYTDITFFFFLGFSRGYCARLRDWSGQIMVGVPQDQKTRSQG
jgi:hypothetical protein